MFRFRAMVRARIRVRVGLRVGFGVRVRFNDRFRVMVRCIGVHLVQERLGTWHRAPVHLEAEL